MWLITICLGCILIIALYLYLIWNFNYWKRRGVRSPRAQPIVGSFPNAITQKRHLAYDLDEIYRAYKENEDFVGIYRSRSPQLLITSPALAHRIFVTDFKHFHDNEVSMMIDEKSDYIFANNPFTMTGELWKERRLELSSGLSMSRIKTVYPVTQKICHKMTEYIRRQTRIPPKEGLDAIDVCLRFTSEVVTDCVLGLNADSFGENPTPIMATIKKIIHQSFGFMRTLYIILVGLFPIINRLYKTRFISQSMEEFFQKLVQDAIDIRLYQMKLTQDRPDFLNYMLQLQQKKQLTTLQLTAHTMTFLLDGFETTSNVLAHCLLLLARHAVAQERLREEIEGIANGRDGNWDFEKLNELPYLDACIHESMRMFPPVVSAHKLCTEPMELINKNGRPLLLRKGDVVVLPLYSFMTDEDHYPNAQEFRPERFLEENAGVKKQREMGFFYGFGDGPRTCLGMRFALVQMKTAIAEILSNFNIKVNPKTRNGNQLDPTYFLAHLKGGIWLDFESRK